MKLVRVEEASPGIVVVLSEGRLDGFGDHEVVVGGPLVAVHLRLQHLGVEHAVFVNLEGVRHVPDHLEVWSAEATRLLEVPVFGLRHVHEFHQRVRLFPAEVVLDHDPRRLSRVYRPA